MNEGIHLDLDILAELASICSKRRAKKGSANSSDGRHVVTHIVAATSLNHHCLHLSHAVDLLSHAKIIY